MGAQLHGIISLTWLDRSHWMDETYLLSVAAERVIWSIGQTFEYVSYILYIINN